MQKRRFRNTLGAAAAAALMVLPAVPAQAAAIDDAAPCQFLMPIGVDDVLGCVCYRAYQIVVLTTGKELSCNINY